MHLLNDDVTRKGIPLTTPGKPSTSSLLPLQPPDEKLIPPLRAHRSCSRFMLLTRRNSAKLLSTHVLKVRWFSPPSFVAPIPQLCLQHSIAHMPFNQTPHSHVEHLSSVQEHLNEESHRDHNAQTRLSGIDRESTVIFSRQNLRSASYGALFPRRCLVSSHGERPISATYSSLPRSLS